MYAVLFTALLCYGFSATNITIGPDSMEGGRYLGAGNEMLASGRFGMKLWAMVMGYGDSGPAFSFCIAVLAAALLVLAAIHFSMIFRMVSGGKISLFGCGVFSCALISYPLMNEIWEYNGANLCVCGGYFLDAVSVYLAHIALNSPDINRRQKRMLLLAALLCMTVVSSGYESLAVVYVFLVFAQFSIHLIYDTQKNWNFSKILRQGLVYAAVLLLGVILRVLVHRLILLTLGIPAQTNGATEIFWAKMPVKHVLWELFWQCLFYYVAMAPSYFPIAELMAAVFLAAAVTAGLALKTRKPSLIVTCGGMFFCLVLLPIIQGKAAPYRCCQVFAVFAALTAMSLYEIARFV